MELVEKKMSILKNKPLVAQSTIESTGVDDKAVVKQAYESPVLINHGDVRDITLGPTVGIGESGNELGRRV